MNRIVTRLILGGFSLLILLGGVLYYLVQSHYHGVQDRFEAWQALAAEYVELVMTEGSVIAWDAEVGEMSVEAGSGYERIYTWKGQSRSSTLRARVKRWYGSLGIYDPGAALIIYPWKEFDGIRRGVVEEGQQHFATIEEAQAWLAERDWGRRVWSPSGLLVEWSFTPSRYQLSVSVWQIVIDGRPPIDFPADGQRAVRVTGRIVVPRGKGD